MDLGLRSVAHGEAKDAIEGRSAHAGSNAIAFASEKSSISKETESIFQNFR
jgi:hypothetical protein